MPAATSIAMAGGCRDYGLEQAIRVRTSGRVKNLCVTQTTDSVVVSGRADTYYVAQLALAAVRESPRAAGESLRQVELKIDVEQRIDSRPSATVHYRSLFPR